MPISRRLQKAASSLPALEPHFEPCPHYRSTPIFWRIFRHALLQSLAEPTGSPALRAAHDEKFAQNLNISDSVNRL
jgi:hypothetical protein